MSANMDWNNEKIIMNIIKTVIENTVQLKTWPENLIVIPPRFYGSEKLMWRSTKKSSIHKLSVQEHRRCISQKSSHDIGVKFLNPLNGSIFISCINLFVYSLRLSMTWWDDIMILSDVWKSFHFWLIVVLLHRSLFFILKKFLIRYYLIWPD